MALLTFKVRSTSTPSYLQLPTPGHFAWSESSVGSPIGGSPGGGSPNVEEIERPKSAGNVKVLCRGNNFGRTLLEFRSSDFAQIFKFLRGGGPRRVAKNSEIWRGSFEKIGAKVHPGRKFEPPISPPNGRRSPPNKICFYQGPQAYNAQWPLRG